MVLRQHSTSSVYSGLDKIVLSGQRYGFIEMPPLSDTEAQSLASKAKYQARLRDVKLFTKVIQIPGMTILFLGLLN